MADRYEDRYRGEDYRRDRGFGRDYGRDDRGLIERAGDEVRSWFGDEEAERRRRIDEQRHGRDWDRYNREPDRYGRDWDFGHRMGLDYGRGRDWRERGGGDERYGWGERHAGETARYDSWGPGGSRDWNEPAYYRSSYTDTGRYGTRGSTAGVGGSREYSYRDDNETGRHGWFAGRGPRGYQRSDERIREDVCDRLADDAWVDASEIDVTVRSGEVTLSGTVRERQDKRRAEDVIEGISGVREVHNNLRVGTGWEGSTAREQQGPAASGGTAASQTSRR